MAPFAPVYVRLKAPPAEPGSEAVP
jgi:hypothetical protein